MRGWLGDTENNELIMEILWLGGACGRGDLNLNEQ